MKAIREYADERREEERSFHKACEKYEGYPEALSKAMRKIIKKDPDYYDPYLTLHGVYNGTGRKKEAEYILDEAYNRAVKLITDDKGEWPDRMEWIYRENRHIIKTILNKAMSLWDNGKKEEALDLFRKLLKTNPNDNPGVRYFILAIRTGMTYAGFERKFNKEGLYDSTLFDWFDENYAKYPDEFKWWDEYQKE
ncbi:MAG: ATP-dependent protease [Candidatus Altiarchaeia archaeon]